MTNLIFIILGSWAIILILKLGIDQFKNFALFLKIIHSNNKEKHSTKKMIISAVKYLVFIIALVLCTFDLFAIALIPFWLLILYISWHYIKLWKYHGYSVLLLIAVYVSVIIGVVFASPFIRQFIMMAMRNWGQIIFIIASLGLIIYTVLSKADSEEAKHKGINENVKEKNLKETIYRRYK